MAALTVQDLAEAGLLATYVSAAGGGDTIADDGSQRTFLHVKNGGGAPITVTVTANISSKVVAGYGTLTRSNYAVAVSNGAEKFIGPFPPDAFKNAGVVSITYSAVTSVTVAAIRVPVLG